MVGVKRGRTLKWNEDEQKKRKESEWEETRLPSHYGYSRPCCSLLFIIGSSSSSLTQHCEYCSAQQHGREPPTSTAQRQEWNAIRPRLRTFAWATFVRSSIFCPWNDTLSGLKLEEKEEEEEKKKLAKRAISVHFVWFSSIFFNAFFPLPIS